MGKGNKAQRTKGNTKPSSSGQCAQLLNQTGNGVSSFIGFNSREKDFPSYVPVTGAEATDVVIHSDFRMAMRKMIKQCPVTRLKATQEFRDLCEEKSKEDILSVLPFWPRLYNKLALDTDRRIREMAQQAHTKLAAKMKRDLAPYLKSITAVWLLGQCDSHLPAAKEASESFNAVFPVNKRPEVFMFCRECIFSAYKDNLFNQTAKTMSDPKTTPLEDMESKYTLVISMTLQALGNLYTLSDSQQNDQLQEDFESIVSISKFWAYSKNREPSIRSAWFNLIFSLCQTLPAVFNGHRKELIKHVLGGMSESNATVARIMWKALLSMVTKIEDCWNDIDINKVFLPQFWSLLKDGGKGNAQVFYPCILPLLSKLPKETLVNETFILTLFGHLTKSFSLNTVMKSNQESTFLVLTYTECLKTICFKILNGNDLGPEILQKVLLEQLMPLVIKSVHQENYHHLYQSCMYSQLGNLLQKIQTALDTSDEETSEKYETILELTFNSLREVFKTIQSLKGDARVNTIGMALYLYYSILHDVAIPDSIKGQKTSIPGADSTVDYFVTDVAPSSNHALFDSLRKDTPLARHIIYILETFHGQEWENQPTEGRFLFSQVLSFALSEEFLPMLMQSFGFDHFLDFYKDIIFNWIQNLVHCSRNVEVLVNPTMQLVKYASASAAGEVETVLNMVFMMKNIYVTSSLLLKGLENKDSFFVHYIQNSCCLDVIVTYLREYMETLLVLSTVPNPEPHTAVFKLFLTSNEIRNMCGDKAYKELLVSLTTFVDEMRKTFLHVQENEVVAYLRLLMAMPIDNSETMWDSPEILKLYLTFFSMTLRKLNLHFSLLDMNLKISCRAFKCYTTHIKSFTHPDGLIMLTAKTLKDAILHLEYKNQLLPAFWSLHHFLDIIFETLPTVHVNASVRERTLMAILRATFPSTAEWEDKQSAVDICFLFAIAKGELYYPFKFAKEFKEGSHLHYVMSAFVVAQLYAGLLPYKTIVGSPLKKTFMTFIRGQMPYLLYAMTYGKSVKKSLRTPCEELVILRRLEAEIPAIVKTLDKENLLLLGKDLVDLSLKRGTTWSLVLQTFIQLWDEFKGAVYLDGILNNPWELYANVSTTMQSLVPTLSSEKKIWIYLGYVTEYFLNLHEENYEVTFYSFALASSILKSYENSKCDETLTLLMMSVAQSLWPERNKDVMIGKEEEFSYLETMVLFLSLKHMDKSVSFDICEQFQSTSLLMQCKTLSFSTPHDFFILHEMTVHFLAALKLSEYENISISVGNKAFEDFIDVFLHLSEKVLKMHPVPDIVGHVLSSLIEIVNQIPEDFALVISMNIGIFKMVHLWLESSVYQIQFLAHSFIMKNINKLTKNLQEIQLNSDDDDETSVMLPPQFISLVKSLENVHQIIDIMLVDLELYRTCLIVPFTDSYTYVTAYLLEWIEVLEFVAASPPQVRSNHVTYLESQGVLPSFFKNVFNFIPEKLDTAHLMVNDTKTLFTQSPVLTPEPPTDFGIERLACYVFALALRKLPASVRTWLNNLDAKSADTVRKFTSHYISGILCLEEIKLVQENENQLGNLVIQTRPSVKEITATYKIDDFALEVLIQFPPAYPLEPIKTERKGKVIVKELEWRHWLMHMATVVTFQNGSILDGLVIWKKNLDKKFEGLEECMICYNVIHGTTYKLPKLSCDVCHKKFHSFCLYKWFSTSNKSSCPLCRNEFSVHKPKSQINPENLFE